MKENNAIITIRTTVVNESEKDKVFNIEENIINDKGINCSFGNKSKQLTLKPHESMNILVNIKLDNPEIMVN